jgi:hypothetical protein
MANFSSTYPSTRPVFNADFSNAGRLDSRITFSRADTASSGNWSAATNSPGLADGSGTANQYYRVSAAGVQDLGSGSISFEVGDYIKYSGSVWFKTTQPISVTYWSNEKHLSSENLFKYSNDLGTGWVEDNLTFTSGQTAPDGGSDAYKVTENSANNEHRSYPTAAISTNGGPTTLSGHFKYIGRQWILFRLNDGSAYRRVWFDIQNGVLGTADTGITASITASGNGFYKCVATIATSNTSYLPVFGGAAANTSIVYTGSGADAFYVWGLQYNHNVGSVLNETSGQIHRAYAPTLKSVSTAGQPRFEYSPTDSASMGLLIEGQSTNKATYSEDFTNGVYTGYRASVDSSAAIAPSGELTADLLREDSTASNTHFIAASTATGLSVGSTQYTVSVFVKAAGRSRFRMFDNNQNTSGDSTFDLSNGTVVAGSGAIESCGNGWYRCSITPTCDYSSNSVVYILLDDGSGTSYTGNGFSGLLLWGYQLETGQTFASSPIATNGSAVTRASDSASMDLTAVGNEVTVTGEAISTAVTSARETVFQVSPSGSTNVSAYAGRATGGGTSSLFYGGSTGVYLSGSTVTAGSAYKFALRTAPANHGMSYNGGTVATETTTVGANDFDTLHIGSRADGSNKLNGHIKRLAVFGEALSDSNLQSLTK